MTDLNDETEKEHEVDFNDNAESEYEVGYKKPPKKHQFKKGESGNPLGRPKVEKPGCISEVLVKTLLEEVPVQMKNGKEKTVQAMEVIARKIIQSAMSGDMPTIRMLFQAKVIDPKSVKAAFLKYNAPKEPSRLSRAEAAVLAAIKRGIYDSDNYDKKQKNKI